MTPARAPTLAKLTCIALATLLATTTAMADEAAIRKNLSARLPQLPRIDEVAKTPIPGVYEIRLGHDVLYTDEQGDHIIQGSLFDTRSKVDLTEARVTKLAAIDVGSLPLKDAIVVKQGTGARTLVVFADPNCGYCKRLERDLLNVKDVTIYTFLYPILGPDSDQKARSIWCAPDTQQTWRAWMLQGVVPPASAAATCDATAIERNVALGRKHRVSGTPTLLFQNGVRAPGALTAAEVEKQLKTSGNF